MKTLPILVALSVLATNAPALACSPPEKPEAIKLELKDAYDLDRAGEYKEAEKGFLAVVKKHPDSRKAYYLLANTYWRDNMYTESRRAWETVLRMDNTDRWAKEAREWLKANKYTGKGSKVYTVAFKDGGKTKSRFIKPTSMVVSDTGNMYVADAAAHYILRIGTDGQLAVAAGSGRAGFRDGDAKQATVTMPMSLAIDPVGNMYFIDGNRVRFLTPDGRVGTLAGWNEAASKDGDWQHARFNHPTALAVDHRGVVYVAEGKVPAIRRITPDGNVSLFAGGATVGYKDGHGADAQFKHIGAMRVTPNGDLLVADTGANLIRRVSPNADVFTLSGCGKAGYMDGPLSMGHFRKVLGVAMDASGNMYLADAGNNSVRMVDAKTHNIETLAGGAGIGNADGVGIEARFGMPTDIALADGVLYVLDRKYATVRKIVVSR